MKYSKYNFVFACGSRHVIYNAASDGVIWLNPDLSKLIGENRNQVEEIEQHCPELYAAMLERRMIVDAELDETSDVIKRWQEEDNNPEHLYLTILPTLNCNLRCWYCYEEHKAKDNMSEATAHAVVRYVERAVMGGSLKCLHLSFFGGEPLLPFRNMVYPMLTKISALCKENDVKLILHFTTNGVLLTQNVIDQLLKLRLADNPAVQITLDGNREFHDRSRHTATKGPTFDTIVKNIHAALRSGFYVTNRFNYTAKSVDSFIDLIDAYADLTIAERERLRFDFQQVWQEEHLESVRQKALNLAEKFCGKKYNVDAEKRYKRKRCKADSENQVTINFDGNVFSCTARDTNKEECEGRLCEDGEIEWNERHRKRMAIKFGNDTCRACRIYPLCHGGCSQLKLEAGDDVKGCIKGYSDAQRVEIIQGRLNFLSRVQRPSENSCKKLFS